MWHSGQIGRFYTTGRGGGHVTNILTFNFNDPSSNPAEGYRTKMKRTKINKNEPGFGPFLKKKRLNERPREFPFTSTDVRKQFLLLIYLLFCPVSITPLSLSISVTRYGGFLHLVIFWAILKNISLKFKTAMVTTFWATFYFNIWPHCSPPYLLSCFYICKSQKMIC